jgi:ribose transport system substrate-binding protein
MMESHPHLQAIFSDTGPAALGVEKAITAMHKVGKVDLFAFSSARQNIAEVEANTVYKAGAMQQPKVEGQVEVGNIAKYLDHKSVPARVLVPVLGVTKANAAARILLSFGKV